MQRPEPVALTVVVLTYNEERNLPDCLASVAGWACDVIVVDSGSTDRTVEIAREHGAVVRTHPFETHAKQWSWALATLPSTADWVLGLDADQRVTAELREEIAAFVGTGASDGFDGGYVKRRQIFRGRWIRHGGYYPKYLLKLFRLGRVRADEGDLVDHHFVVAGKTAKFSHDIVEDNRNEADISVWIDKHNRYARLQAIEEMNATAGVGSRVSDRTSPDARIARLKAVWRSLPLFVRPCLYFTYRYVLRLGFLDGKEGFIFHVLQAFWYRLLVDIKIDEMRRARRGDAPAAAHGMAILDAPRPRAERTP